MNLVARFIGRDELLLVRSLNPTPALTNTRTSRSSSLPMQGTERFRGRQVAF